MKWRTAKLVDICEINIGRTPSRSVPSYWKDGTKHWLSIADMSVAKYITDTKEKITDEAVAKTGIRLVEPNTVLLSYKLSVGKVCISKIPLHTNEAIAALPIKNNETVDTQYLMHALSSIDFYKGADRAAKGLTLNKEKLSVLEISLPPLAEQRRIAAVLDKAEEIKRKRELAIAKLDQLAQSVFVEMFGDPIKNEKSYKCESLANLCHRIQIGPFGTQLHEEDYVENGIPLVNPTHIKNGKINPNNKLTITPEKHASLSQYHLKEGDLILGRRGEMGRCAIVNKDQENWLCGTGSLFLQLDRNKIHPLYLYSVLSSPSMRKHLESVAQGVTMANLNKDIIGNIKISLPSIQEQIIYEKAKDSSKYIFEMMDSSLKNIINLSSSLQHQAFTTGFET